MKKVRGAAKTTVSANKKKAFTFTLSCFFSFHKHLSTYNWPKKKKVYFKPRYSTLNERSGFYMDKYHSKVQSTGSRVAPCFLTCESFKQEAVEKLKGNSIQRCCLDQLHHHLGTFWSANSQAAPDLGIKSSRNRTEQSCFNRTSKWFWWQWSLRTTAA